MGDLRPTHVLWLDYVILGDMIDTPTTDLGVNTKQAQAMLQVASVQNLVWLFASKLDMYIHVITLSCLPTLHWTSMIFKKTYKNGYQPRFMLVCNSQDRPAVSWYQQQPGWIVQTRRKSFTCHACKRQDYHR